MTAFYWFAATLFLYAVADILYQKSGHKAFLHPVFIPVFVLVSVFCIFNMPLEPFVAGTYVFTILLAAAVAALALPLYRNLSALKRDPAAILAAIAGGSISSTGSALVVAYFLHAPPELMASLATKSVTTPIAVEIVRVIGGIPSVAAATVIIAGLFVAVFGPGFLRLLGVDDDLSMGLALGTVGHGLGMAESVRRSDLMGAAAAFSMASNGLVTALMLPILWPYLIN
ncbi:LrgB family protein [Kordiimonas pumila]|uniref:LrgB family protein n=1 Tax=Kordiimonas pumila TaxID=2161677 RepID=A0ABV7D490_9PROT|nr:LrgB family protein [Kordiimonas pumila]